MWQRTASSQSSQHIPRNSSSRSELPGQNELSWSNSYMYVGVNFSFCFGKNLHKILLVCEVFDIASFPYFQFQFLKWAYSYTSGKS